METLSASPSIDPRHKIVIDGYHQAQYMYPQAPLGYPIPCHPQGSSFCTHGHYPKPAAQNPYPGYNYQEPLVQEPSPTTSIGRVMLILMIVLVSGMCMMSLVMWFLFGTYIPEFQVASLKVSNFTATNTTLTGIWDVNVVVRNTNEEFAIDFENVKSVVLYRGNILGISSLQSFEIQKKKEFDLNFSVPADQTLNVDNLQSWVLPTLAQDWSNGAVVFSLTLSMDANFSSPDRGYREGSLTVSCDNMQISFSPATDGELSQGLGSRTNAKDQFCGCCSGDSVKINICGGRKIFH
ncbi:hypothetical protein Pfo_004065 [Paulownia fortunei]|nr:hypothetical protein Pfo_004065 [Paulownia fortunei]